MKNSRTQHVSLAHITHIDIEYFCSFFVSRIHDRLGEGGDDVDVMAIAHRICDAQSRKY